MRTASVHAGPGSRAVLIMCLCLRHLLSGTPTYLSLPRHARNPSISSSRPSFRLVHRCNPLPYQPRPTGLTMLPARVRPPALPSQLSTWGSLIFAPIVTVWFRQLQRINLGSRAATTVARVRCARSSRSTAPLPGYCSAWAWTLSLMRPCPAGRPRPVRRRTDNRRWLLHLYDAGPGQVV